jgi:hypothetical protein
VRVSLPKKAGKSAARRRLETVRQFGTVNSSHAARVNLRSAIQRQIAGGLAFETRVVVILSLFFRKEAVPH